MKLFEKLTIKILLLASGFLIFTVTLFSFFFLNCANESKQPTFPNETVRIFCGTNLSETAHEGKQLFNMTCAACHKLDAIMTGPALYNTDAALFRKWMYYEKSKIDTTKLEQLGIDYHLNLSKQIYKVSDLERIYAYIGK